MPKTHRVPLYRRPITITLCLLLVLAIAGMILFVLSHWPTTDGPIDPGEDPTFRNPIPVESPSSTDSEQSSGSGSDDSVPPSAVSQFEGDSPQTSAALTGHVSYLGLERDAARLNVTSVIDQYLSSGGACTLELQSPSGAKVYSDTKSILADVTSSFCGPWAIDISGFSPGQYKIIITMAADGREGRIEETTNI